MTGQSKVTVGGYIKLENASTVYTITKSREEARYYQIGIGSQFRIMISSKPKWLARVMSKWLLGWIWCNSSKIDK